MKSSCIQQLRPRLFPWKLVSGNQFPNFPVFVCHQESWSTENTFWSTENTFQSTENTFQSMKNLVWFSGKCFPFSCVCFPESGFTTFQTFLCLFAIRKVGQWKTLYSKRKIWLGFQESVFLKNLGENNLDRKSTV